MVPIDNLGKPRETSPLLPRRDSSAPDHMWKTVAAISGRASALTNGMSLLQSAQKKIVPNTHSSYGMHPWKIYPYVGNLTPAEEEIAGITTDNRWRTFRVRTGKIQWSPLLDFFRTREDIVTGTDMYSGLGNVDPMTDAVFSPFTKNGFQPEDIDPNSIYNSVFVLNEESITYFFLEVFGNVAELRHTESPEAIGWEYFPTYNPYFIPVGMVDTRNFGPELPRVRILQCLFSEVDLYTPVKNYGTHGTPTHAHENYVLSMGYPLNAVVTKFRREADGIDYNGTYLSLSPRNTSPVTSPSWLLLGEYADV